MRGGECKVIDMTKNAKNHEKKHPGEFALSGFCVPGLDPDETAVFAREQGDQYLPQPKIRAITVGELRDAGFAVQKAEPPPGHVAIMMSAPLSDEELTMLEGMLGPCLVNPVAR